MDNEKWIKTLKPGDKVAVKQNDYGTITYSIQTVKRVTPTGKVRLENDSTLYASDGRGRHDGGHSFDIVQLSDEIKESILKRRIVNKLKKVDFSAFELGKLRNVLKIIEGE